MSEFSLITHHLPETINVGDKTYRIDTRTCRAMQCFIIADDQSEDQFQRELAIVSSMVYANVPKDLIHEAYQRIAEYLDGYPVEKPRGHHDVLLSLSQDHNLIVAAFRQEYGISLTELKAMHWWEFLALLSGISGDTRLGEVMKIRGMEITSKDSPDVRQAKIKAKQAVAIKRKRKANESGMDVISAALESEG